MTITVVSAPLAGNTPSASSGSGLGADSGGSGGFGDLFSQIIGNRSFQEADLQLQATEPQALSVELPEPLALPVALENAPLLSGTESLQERIAAILGNTPKTLKKEIKATEEDAVVVVPLQAPVTSLPAAATETTTDLLATSSPRMTVEQFLAEARPEAKDSANLAVPREEFSRLAGTLAANAPAPSKTELPQNMTPEIRTPVQDPRWSQDFGEKIVWMARNDQQQAQLSLSPAHLGPLQITLNLDASKASAMFIAATPEVQQAIEDAMPRLREMLAGAGISLGQTSVGTQSQQEQQSMAQNNRSLSQESGDKAILGADSNTLPPVISRQGLGMVDLFA